MNRRTWLGVGAAALGAVGLTWWQRNPIARWALTRRTNQGVALSALKADEQTCVVTPEQVEGPFFFHAPQRSDIREDRTGVPLDLQLRVIQAGNCAPIAGALVELWHCDAAGRYSGYPEDLSRRPFETMLYLSGQDVSVPPENEKLFLRGAQTTDAQGTVAFTTIFPGWYEPRVAHIHAKVFIDGRSYTTTQLYFPDKQAHAIYSRHPDYAPHGLCPYNHDNDVVLGSNPEAQGLLLHTSNQSDGLAAQCQLAVA